MQAWWWRSVTVCAALAAVAGSVAVVSAALTADRSEQLDRATQAARAPVVRESGPIAAERPRPSVDDRVADTAVGVSLRSPTGWHRVSTQRLVPVPAGRFPILLAPDGPAADDAVLLVGTLDPARVGEPVDPARLEAETDRLVGAFTTGASPPGGRAAALGDTVDTVDGRPGWTSARRIDGSRPTDPGRPTDGTLVRVTTVAGGPRGVVALAVTAPGPRQAADTRAADGAVHSLDLTAGPGGRPEQPIRPGAPAPAPGPAPPRPTVGPRPSPPARPVPPPRPAPPATAPPAGRPATR